MVPPSIELARARNSWVAEYCAADPARLKGTAVLPQQDVPAAVAELRRSVTELGFVGVSFFPNLRGRHMGDPYFFPIYSLLVLMIYGVLSAFVDVEPYRRWLFGAIGFTWTFHLTFTIWMLWNGQTDLIEHGTFFSMMLIYLINFATLSLMLILASRDVTFWSFGRELLQGAMDFSDLTLRLAHFKP